MKHSFIAAAALFASSSFLHAEPQPDFVLADVNPGSERGGHTVSPRDYRQQVSVFYFGREW